MNTTAPKPYIGRFAPSPSGPLHFGSLIAALGSFLQARHHQGRWLLRIEDLDPPREVPGAADEILFSLDAFGLHWDGPVLYQSQRLDVYQHLLEQWEKRGLTYYCHCSRKEIAESGGFYNGHCRYLNLGAKGSGTRLIMSNPVYEFVDLLQGKVKIDRALAEEDFIVRRRDGFYAYNLAVVIDDAHTGISEVVRGADLLAPTGRQISLYQQLNAPVPSWLHLPLATVAGNKLSKQNHAPALDINHASNQLCQALRFLGQAPPATLATAPVAEVLAWAIAHWQLQQVPKTTQIAL
ncbi:tRNA glutamyl-Q(34) synthetase GluQRS [Oceanisphaera avium]|uniref:Glutamyl-Q tRNA(Asp) synthetase n=1 Tax=Oceanisphaera avium TaxID=1903694 RepID=A0A1Y0CZC2_9GAMM|nr:tRNA glutamyl-Q(34) synthetase GluQRS [Oceanisphaera avium]ART80247.1 tRNA glutamyl-Q(34) synthetase GluQRS [Oceanisphaera avium]